MIKILLLVVTLIGTSTLTIYIYRIQSSVPTKWNGKLTFYYEHYAGEMNRYEKYSIHDDSIVCQVKYYDEKLGHYVEPRFSKSASEVERNGLLQVLKENKMDHVKLRKRNTIIHDGPDQYVIRLSEGDKRLVDVDNSHNMELYPRDYDRFNKVVDHLDSLVRRFRISEK
jgi:hypothetical protein